jgi:hypothetical protein
MVGRPVHTISELKGMNVAGVYDSRSKLKRHVDRLIGKQSQADVLDIIRQSRFVLEQDKALKQTLPTLSLYCDWAQHVMLDRNEYGWAVLERLDAAMTSGGQSNFQAAMQQALQLGQLQTELETLLTNVGAATRLVTERENWSGFLFLLLNDLCDRPIEWLEPRNRKAQAVYERMMAARPAGWRSDMFPHSLSLEHKDGHEGLGFYYNVIVKKDGPYNATLVGQLFAT